MSRSFAKALSVVLLLVGFLGFVAMIPGYAVMWLAYTTNELLGRYGTIELPF
jgi:phage shock protein PspC (stress-responsive transcriptional regulator)